MRKNPTKLKARLALEIGTRVYLRRWWGEGCGKYGYHNATNHLFDIKKMINGKDEEGETTYHRYGGGEESYPESHWPTKCDHCGQPTPADAPKQVFNQRLYDTPSGELEPGCLFYAPWCDDVYWDNQTTPSLCAILPNGGHWVIDGRASNCTMPKDKTHRCWVRHGEPPNITVDKKGHSCSAGAGSIAQGNYHGYLRNGYFET